MPRRLRTLAFASIPFACGAPAEPAAPGSSSEAGGSGSSGAPAPGTSGAADSTSGAAGPGSSDGAVDGSDGTPADSTAGVGDRVAMFVATGALGRVMTSCDDGRTWIADHSWDEDGDPLLCGSTDPVRCDETPCQFMGGDTCESAEVCDCGHSPGFAKGVAWGNGVFVATWGWGFSGSVRRSSDGIHWEQTLTDDVTFGGLAFGAERFVLSSRNPRYSNDGLTWTAGQEADFRGTDGEIAWSVRRFGFVDYDGGRFVATANPPQSVLVSSDGGGSWWAPTSIPGDCLASAGTYGGIASGNGIIVGVGDDGIACRSTDGGETWTTADLGNQEIYARLLWTGSEFVTWAPGLRFTSPDGATWSSVPTTPEGIWIGPVARNEDTGTFAANVRVWSAYEEQQMVRSADGIDWELLEPGVDFRGGHSIFEIGFGWGEPSDVCPGA